MEAHAAQTAKLDALTRAAGEASEIRGKETEAARLWSDVAGDKHRCRRVFTAVGLGFDVVAGEPKLRGKKHLEFNQVAHVGGRASQYPARLAGGLRGSDGSSPIGWSNLVATLHSCR